MIILRYRFSISSSFTPFHRLGNNLQKIYQFDLYSLYTMNCTLENNINYIFLV